jgi:hypothetical protein
MDFDFDAMSFSLGSGCKLRTSLWALASTTTMAFCINPSRRQVVWTIIVAYFMMPENWYPACHWQPNLLLCGPCISKALGTIDNPFVFKLSYRRSNLPKIVFERLSIFLLCDFFYMNKNHAMLIL